VSDLSRKAGGASHWTKVFGTALQHWKGTEKGTEMGTLRTLNGSTVRMDGPNQPRGFGSSCWCILATSRLRILWFLRTVGLSCLLHCKARGLIAQRFYCMGGIMSSPVSLAISYVKGRLSNQTPSQFHSIGHFHTTNPVQVVRFLPNICLHHNLA